MVLQTNIHYCPQRAPKKSTLVVLSVGLSLGIQNTGPVVCLKVGLSIDINLNLYISSFLTDWVCWDSDWVEKSSEELSDTIWAPLDDLSCLQGELGSKNRVLDGSVTVDFSERKRLVDWWAFIAKSVDGSLWVNGNADGKASSDTGSGGTRLWEVLQRDAWHVGELALEESIELG